MDLSLAKQKQADLYIACPGLYITSGLEYITISLHKVNNNLTSKIT